MSFLRTSLTPLALAAFAAPAVADLLVVDNGFGPGADYFTLQTAVDAAAHGDTLLVRGSTVDQAYAGFDSVGKALILVGDPAEGPLGELFPPRIVGRLELSAVPAGGRFVMRGFDVEAQTLPFLDPPLVTATSSPGTLVFEDCTFGGENVPTPTLFDLDDVGLVTFANCVVAGIDGKLGLTPSAGIRGVDTDVHLWNSVVSGGDGTDGELQGIVVIPAQEGRDAVRLVAGDLFTSGSTLTGGDGGTGTLDVFGNCTPSQPGGDGVRLLPGSGPAVHWLRVDTQTAGGAGGDFVTAICGPAADGTGDGLGSATMTELDGVARTFDVPVPPRENGPFEATLGGEEGELVFLVFSLNTLDLILEPWNGVLVPAPTFTAPLGTVPAGGTLDLSLPIGPIPIEALAFQTQSLFVSPSLTKGILSPPVTLVVLDDAL